MVFTHIFVFGNNIRTNHASANMATVSRIGIILLFSLIAVSNCGPVFELDHNFLLADNFELIAVIGADNQESIAPPGEQEGVPSPSDITSWSISPSPSVTTSSSSSPSVPQFPSASISPRVSAFSGPSQASKPSLSPAPSSVECPQIYVDGKFVPESELLPPMELTANTPSAQLFGEDPSLCAFHVKVPAGAKTYTATFSADGRVGIHVAFEGYPSSIYSEGADYICESQGSPREEKCEGDLKGAKQVYLKAEGFSKFSNGVVEVSFDVIPPYSPSPSPAPGAIFCKNWAFESGKALPIITEPVWLPANTPVGPHSGKGGSECFYYVNVPEKAINFEARTTGSGDMFLSVAFVKNRFSVGHESICHVGLSESCRGNLIGNKKVFVLLEGSGPQFSNVTVTVKFDVPN